MSVMPPNEFNQTRKAPPRKGKLTSTELVKHLSGTKNPTILGFPIELTSDKIYAPLKVEDFFGKYTSLTEKEARTLFKSIISITLHSDLPISPSHDFPHDVKAWHDALVDEVQYNKTLLKKDPSNTTLKDDLAQSKDELAAYQRDKTAVLIHSLNKYLAMRNHKIRDLLRQMIQEHWEQQQYTYIPDWAWLVIVIIIFSVFGNVIGYYQ